MKPREYPRSRAFIAWLARHNRSVLVVSLGIALVASLSLLRLRLDMDLLSMLPRGKPAFTDYQRYIERFGAQDLVIALVRAPDADTAIAFADAFAAALRGDPEILEVHDRVDLAAFAQALRGGMLPLLLPLDAYPEVARRLSPEGINAAVRNLVRILAAPGSVGVAKLLADDPLGLARLLADALARSRPDRAFGLGREHMISPDGQRLVVLIRPAHAGYDVEAVERLSRRLEAAEAGARGAVADASRVSVGYTGAFAYARDDASLLRQDMLLYMVLALAGVLTVFVAGYRNLRILPFITYHMLLATLLTFALALVFTSRLNAVSLSFAAIFYGLSIDAAIHFYTRFLEEWRPGEPLEPALAATIGAMLPPTLVSAATTSAAFTAIGFSNLAGVAQLGFLTAAGMLLNVVATFTLLPALMLWLARRSGRPEVERAFPRAIHLGALAGAVSRHRWLVRGLALLVLVVAGVSARSAILDTNLFHLRPAGSPASAVQDEIEQHFGLSDPDGAVLAESTRSGEGAPDDSVLAATEQIAVRLEAYQREGLVQSVVSPTALLPSRATEQARLDAWNALPRARAARDLEAALAGAGFKLEPFAPALALLRAEPAPSDPLARPLPGLELLFERHVRRDAQGSAVLTSFAPRDGAALEEVARRLPRELATPSGASITVTGRPLMERELHRTMHAEVVGFLLATIASNLVLVWLRERSLARSLALVAVPLGVVVLILGLSGALGLPLTPVNLIVLPLTIGIGVDNCVYLIERMHETGDVEEAVARAGRAVTITAATTIVGFGVLAFSRYPGLSGLGVLAAASMVLCFVGAVAVLPALVVPGSWSAARAADPALAGDSGARIG